MIKLLIIHIYLQLNIIIIPNTIYMNDYHIVQYVLYYVLIKKYIYILSIFRIDYINIIC